ncbi:LuxR C-terminal-related transcriptional regulator [Nonomuraea sp. ATR24]|uniref:ATP-binding protein n=1 Tax=Nonomuraea TaxID=83681 RepID=UPI001C5D91BC|nr:LuxR C-terminal-related transcriptional regulator [Nonomuraea ceibae]
MREAPRHNLPAEPNSFVGRERDIGELCRLVGDARLVTLCGIGGIGKTRLALRVAAQCAPAYPEGVWLAELARISRPELVVREIARALGVREERGRPLLGTVAARLRDGRCLLVLDNCEHLIDECAEVAAALLASWDELAILATSREPLRIAGELVWRVPPLDLPEGAEARAESVRLFLDRAAAAGTRLDDGSLPDVVRLCRELDGLPLALELAAARTSLLSPGQIADRVHDRFSLLTTGERTAPARQRTLLAAVEWSYDLLSDREQVLLRRLSVFAGPFDLDLAEQVCGGPPIAGSELVDLLGALVDKSLVLCDESRSHYRLLATIRHYAAGLLREAGEHDALRERHLAVLCELQERYFATELVEPGVPWPRRLEALTRSRGLLDDQRAALDWAAESGDVDRALRLCSTSTGLLPVSGNPLEIVGWIERLLALDLSGVTPGRVAQADGFLAYGLEARDELGRSLEYALRSLEDLDEGFQRCVMHSLLVMVLLRMGRAGEAAHHAELGLALATAAGDTWNQAAGLAGLSAVALVRGRLREAQRHGDEALARACEHGHRWIMARAATQLGAVAEARGDLATAKARYELAVPWLDELGGGVDLARVLARIGRVAALLGEFATARERLAASLELSRRTGQRQGVARCLVGLSVLAEAEGDLESAVPAAAAAAALRASIGQRSGTARIEELLARARAKLGEGRTTALWARGGRMSPDDAARLVLEGVRPPEADPGPPTPPGAMPLAITPSAGGPLVGALPVGHSPLTAREREIAGLLTGGLSNRAIAEELVISPATVARHIANIMEKLGYTSRAQIAVWAAEQPSA